jgi:NtrC-family two-component system response regulator AlgB
MSEPDRNPNTAAEPTTQASPSAQPPLRILLIDDERNIRKTMRACLEADGHRVWEAEGEQAALVALGRESMDLAFLDLRLGQSSGLDLLPLLLAERPGLTVVIITAYASVDTAIEAIRRGARDYLPKPFTPAQLRLVVGRLQERLAAERHVIELQAQLDELAPPAELETHSHRMRAVLDLIHRAADSDVTVLLRGESGVGKGMFARALHAGSARRQHPFIVVNCPTLSAELLASELFGHTRGAFTGAVRDQEGRVEAAAGGTLFLDEIGELPPPLQAKILRFLQDKEYERVGETRPRRADVRVLAATNRDLEADVKAGRFREDLWFRLNVVEITIPPLRERPEDILPLAQHLLTFLARSARRPTPDLSEGAKAALLAYPWPGNVRELRNALERALILWPANVLEREALPDRIAGSVAHGPEIGGDVTLDELEREHILRVLARSRTQEEAATVLGIDTSTLWRKRKRFEESE